MRRFTTAILLACLSLTALADDTGHKVTMWLAEGERNRVYLLGSIHLLRKQDHPLPAVFDEAYDDADALVMELDMDDIDPFALQALTNQMGVLHDETTLRDLMGDELYATAERTAAEVDIPFDMLAKTEPWFAAITVEQLVLMRLGFNPLYGIEMHMTMKATQDGKTVDGLETVEEQLGFLDGLSLEAQNELLIQTLSETGEVEEVMDELIRAWRYGDTAYLEENMLEDMQDYPELYAAIVADRNRRWVAAIEDLLDDDQDYLIVVGALHLVGDDGVPRLLSGRGVRIAQLHEDIE